jgi:anti-sigma factor RsiW
MKMNKFMLKMMLKMMLHPMAYTCRDTAKLLLDYVEGTLEPGKRRKLDAHLADCPECQAFLATYRETIRLTRGALPPESEMPPELRDRLVQFLKAN